MLRFLVILLSSLVMVGAVLLAVRIWGLSKPIQTYDSDFFRTEQKLSWVVPVSLQDRQEGKFKQLLSQRLFKDMGGPEAASRIIWLVDIAAEKPEALELSWLKEFLEVTKPSRVIFRVLVNFPNIDLKLNDLVAKEDEHRVMIQSSYDVILRSIKNLRPQLVYGSSPADETKLHFYNELRILPAVPLLADVYWAQLSPAKGVFLRPEIPVEIRRRKKKFFLGPVIDKESYAKALSFGPDAIVFDSFQSASQTLDSITLD